MKKKITAIVAILLLMILSCMPVFAEVTTDYTYAEDEQFDLCVFNIWSDAETGVTPTVLNINKITMTVTISDFQGDPIDVKLYSREQATWTTWASEAQTISQDGTYTFEIDFGENAFSTDMLATIYIKDVRCCVAPDEDADGQSLESSGITCHAVLDSIEFNKEDGSDDTSETEAADNTTEPADTATTAAASASSESGSSNGLPIGAIIGIAAGAVIIVAVIVIVVVNNKKKK
ncbi:MAG: hypothetical protein PUB17_03540 [Lachnospiraceae bacterium]|nr:hypothetical protein [Lachnospiraceae bacterium]